MNIDNRLKFEAEEIVEEFLTNRHRIIQAYIDGAKSERNKVLDEAIDIVTDYQDYNPLIIERLKALKV